MGFDEERGTFSTACDASDMKYCSIDLNKRLISVSKRGEQINTEQIFAYYLNSREQKVASSSTYSHHHQTNELKIIEIISFEFLFLFFFFKEEALKLLPNKKSLICLANVSFTFKINCVKNCNFKSDIF